MNTYVCNTGKNDIMMRAHRGNLADLFSGFKQLDKDSTNLKPCNEVLLVRKVLCSFQTRLQFMFSSLVRCMRFETLDK